MFQAVSLIPPWKPPRFQGTDRTPAHPGAEAAAPDTSHSAGQPHASSPRPSVPWNPCSHHSSLALPPCHRWRRRSAPAWHKAKGQQHLETGEIRIPWLFSTHGNQVVSFGLSFLFPIALKGQDWKRKFLERTQGAARQRGVCPGMCTNTRQQY